MWEVYKEMIPALIKQCNDPTYYTDRSAVVPPALPVPAPSRPHSIDRTSS